MQTTNNSDREHDRLSVVTFYVREWSNYVNSDLSSSTMISNTSLPTTAPLEVLNAVTMISSSIYIE